MPTKKPLPVPPPAARDPKSVEMMRAWIAEGDLHVALNIGFWVNQDANEPDAWGLLLSDVVRHIANAHEQRYGRDPRETIIAVQEAIERGLAGKRSVTGRSLGEPEDR
jgi:hypothetical protein